MHDGGPEQAIARSGDVLVGVLGVVCVAGVAWG